MVGEIATRYSEGDSGQNQVGTVASSERFPRTKFSFVRRYVKQVSRLIRCLWQQPTFPAQKFIVVQPRVFLDAPPDLINSLRSLLA